MTINNDKNKKTADLSAKHFSSPLARKKNKKMRVTPICLSSKSPS